MTTSRAHYSGEVPELLLHILHDGCGELLEPIMESLVAEHSWIFQERVLSIRILHFTKD